MPRPGDVLRVGREASVQFAGDRALTVRLIAVSAAPTYHGWAWITAYVLDRHGRATDRRELYVQLDGLLPVSRTPAARAAPRVPVPRTAPRPSPVG
jgi:hypothetical protein